MIPPLLHGYETESYTKMQTARQRELDRLRKMQFPEFYPKQTSPAIQAYDEQRVVRAPSQGGITNAWDKRVFYGSG